MTDSRLWDNKYIIIPFLCDVLINSLSQDKDFDLSKITMSKYPTKVAIMYLFYSKSNLLFGITFYSQNPHINQK